MMAYGNEPSGNYVAFLDEWLEHFKRKDPRMVYTGASIGSSWSIIPKSEFIVRSKPRGLKWKDKRPESLFDYRDRLENQERPYVSHEMGQWCVFPNFQEIEAIIRTPGFAGFQLLSLNDFSGQGTALVGVLDAFWDEKGYITSGEFRKFCDSTVALARIPRFVFTNTENFTARLEVSHFWSQPVENAEISGYILNNYLNMILPASISVINWMLKLKIFLNKEVRYF